MNNTFAKIAVIHLLQNQPYKLFNSSFAQ